MKIRAQQPVPGLCQELPRLYAQCQGRLERVGGLPLHLAAVAKDAVHINGHFLDPERLRRFAAARRAEHQLPSRACTYIRW